jgi:hypothetical protein
MPAILAYAEASGTAVAGEFAAGFYVAPPRIGGTPWNNPVAVFWGAIPRDVQVDQARRSPLF